MAKDDVIEIDGNVVELVNGVDYTVEKEETTQTDFKQMTVQQRREAIEVMELEMRAAAKDLNFEKAAQLRDMILELRAQYKL